MTKLEFFLFIPAVILLACFLLWKLLIFIVWNVERTIFFRSVRSYRLVEPKAKASHAEQ